MTIVATGGRVLAAILALAVLAWDVPATAQQRVGVNSAVNPDADGTPPGAVTRRLVLGQEVVHNEHIVTGGAGQTQILFVDESTMTIAPHSDVTIDEFVYDPSTGKGQMAVSAAVGVLRFVGGKLSKNENAVTVRTPTATLAIRGGAFLMDQQRNGQLDVTFLYGLGLRVTGTNGAWQDIIRYSYGVTVAGPGASPSTPGPMPQGSTSRYLNAFGGRAGSSGGSRNPPTDNTVASSGIDTTISGNVAASVQAANQNRPPSLGQPQTVNIASLQTNLQVNTVSPPTNTNTTPPSAPPPPAPPPPAGNAFPNTTGIAGGINVLGSGDPSRGFPNPIMPYSNATVQNGVFSGTSANFSGSIPLSQGSATFTNAGTSPVGPLSGSTFATPDNTFFYADFAPVAQPSQTVFLYGGTPVNQSFYQATSSTPTITAYTVAPDAVLQSPIPFISQAAGGVLGNDSSFVSPLYFATPANSTFSTGTASTKALQASLAINGSAAQQNSVLVVLVGNVFGSPPDFQGVIHSSYLPDAASQPIRTNAYYQPPLDGNGNRFYGANTISGFVLSPGAGTTSAVAVNTATQATSNFQYAQPLTATTTPPAVANGTQTTQNFIGYFGGIMTKEPVTPTGPSSNTSPIPYVLTGTTAIATNASNLQLMATLAGGDPFTAGASGIPANNGMILQFGSLSPGGTNARQAFINDNLFAAFESPASNSTVNGVTVPQNSSSPSTTNPNIYLVTQTAAPATSLLPNGLCACNYLQWGYWGGEIDAPASGHNAARTDVGNINFWMAGNPTPVADINTLAMQNAQGSYHGSAIGTVVNGAATYLAAGNFSQTYNFASQAGMVNITNFDGANYSAAVSGQAGLFAGNFAGTPNRAGGVAGSFFGPMAASTGGRFQIQSTAGPNYLASGVFGGGH